MKTILITGGTGFIGQELRTMLLQAGHSVIVVTRKPEKYADEAAKNQQFISWDDDLPKAMNSTDVVINLAGENLFSQRWTDEVKNRIYNSRIDTTRKIVEAMRNAEDKPELLISASASGIYGDRKEEILTEEASVATDFLAKVCIDWENEAQKASEFGVRVVNPRIGIVLEENGGALEKMLTPFKLFVGGPISDGKQYMSWIHRTDLCRSLLFPMENNEIVGPFNACAPEPVTMNTLAETLGSIMNRPSIFRVPEITLKVLFGEGAKPILDSIRMQPKVLQVQGFEFRFESLEEALADIVYD
ncbi:MAG TPA: TIGR01777 family protein [Balneolaceae bacterium]|nr:TIGR01777 family protein [Balneolaceae bacterium]|tara:strand:+ start:15229 stop:16134 length:906 start_codon:yes stop_codon:yes gene_type:complete